MPLTNIEELEFQPTHIDLGCGPYASVTVKQKESGIDTCIGVDPELDPNSDKYSKFLKWQKMLCWAVEMVDPDFARQIEEFTPPPNQIIDHHLVQTEALTALRQLPDRITQRVTLHHMIGPSQEKHLGILREIQRVLTHEGSLQTIMPSRYLLLFSLLAQDCGLKVTKILLGQDIDLTSYSPRLARAKEIIHNTTQQVEIQLTTQKSESPALTPPQMMQVMSQIKK